MSSIEQLRQQIKDDLAEADRLDDQACDLRDGVGLLEDEITDLLREADFERGSAARHAGEPRDDSQLEGWDAGWASADLDIRASSASHAYVSASASPAAGSISEATGHWPCAECGGSEEDHPGGVRALPGR